MSEADRKIIREQLHRLLDLVIETNGLEPRRREITGTLPTVHFEYYGNVNKVVMYIRPDGYDSVYGDAMKEMQTLIDCYVNEPIPDKFIDKAEKCCKAALGDNKESEVLLRDIERETARIVESKKRLTNMKEQYERLSSEGR